jgi:hypothetical protein
MALWKSEGAANLYSSDNPRSSRVCGDTVKEPSPGEESQVPLFPRPHNYFLAVPQRMLPRNRIVHAIKFYGIGHSLYLTISMLISEAFD